MRTSGRSCVAPAIGRPAKFAIVGAIGIAVQLGTLHLLGGFGWNYILATGAAVETALVHNFVWHEKFTWRDRNGSTASGLGSRFLRFHLSNGFISLVGNILMMRIFVGELAMHLLVANLLSITICSFLNFIASDRWVFATGSLCQVKPLNTGAIGDQKQRTLGEW